MPGPLSREEFLALGEIAKERRRVMVNMFSGTQLKFGRKSSAEVGKNLVSSGKKLHGDISKLARGTKEAAKSAPSIPGMQAAFHDFMAQCANVSGIEDIVAAIGSEAVKNLVAEVTPVLGVLTSGAKLVKAGKTVAEDSYNLYKSSDYKQGFLRGDPYAAAEAIQIIIKRDLARHSARLQ